MGPNEPPQKHEEEESDKIYEREAAARIRRTPRRSRGYVRRENTAACLTNTSNASTNGFSVRISGTYSVSGAAKNAVENRSCSIRAPPALPLSLSLSVERWNLKTAATLRNGARRRRRQACFIYLLIRHFSCGASAAANLRRVKSCSETPGFVVAWCYPVTGLTGRRWDSSSDSSRRRIVGNDWCHEQVVLGKPQPWGGGCHVCRQSNEKKRVGVSPEK
ncbi:hypothetical protein BHE74_00021817 [Ensete ventricosum]|nr:hypothetical protein BHE74_00021817 [Ensete ventricosum]